MRIFLGSVILALSALLGGCGSTVPPVTNFPYQPQGVQLYITAPDNLNYYGQQAHALTLAALQTEQLEPFYPFLKGQDGMINLLMNRDNKFMMQRFFIQPSDQRVIGFDRNAKTQYLVFVAGYADLLPLQSTQIVKIPLKTTSSGFLWLDETHSATTVYVYILLGPQGIVDVRACDEPLKPKKTCGKNLLE